MPVNNQQGRDRPKPNKQAPSVRNDDRRVRKTQVALIGAFVELVLEKRYDAITIQDLLDRADVGRSTFYAHYRGKDDLLAKSFIGMLAMLDREIDRDGPGAAVSRRSASCSAISAKRGSSSRPWREHTFWSASTTPGSST
jgi:AcrR family transcriptional regulator